ncbi:MAG: methionine--tRNA ligase [Candidatus Kapabacteria bacterium]|nr:methionine--tRNA ligase [Candidatus Kapabacteria bacterium]
MRPVKRYLITSALPYASGVTHLGNVVGSTLPADIYARYCRLRGRDTLSICGSDEHGVAITIAAEKEGVTPQTVIDRYHRANASALEGLDIQFDLYDRTSNPIHADTAQEFFRVWQDKGLLERKEDDQFYDEESSMFLPDRYVEGVCPNCGYDKARGDQCDSCGAYYDQLDLKSPRSLISGKTPVVRKTTHWYFRLDAFQQWCEQYIESHAGDWKDNVLQQSRSWLKQGLSPRSATRDMSWGIPVPADDADGKVLYVWFEAVLGYISMTKQWAANEGSPDAWRQWWCSADTEYTAFLGKDNIVFHTIIFPILLATRADEGYILPKNVPANEFLNLEGQKFSKSRNWAIDVQQYLEAFPEKQHVDVVRYVLTMNMPETKDSDFTWRDFQARTNNELAAILGNYVNRVMTFVHKNFDGAVPAVPAAFVAGDHEGLLAESIQTGLHEVARNLDGFRFRDAATEAMNVARAANKYFNDKAPWKSIKENPDDCAATMNVCLQTIRTLSVLFAPFLPEASATMQSMLGTVVNAGAPKQNKVGADTWQQAGEHLLTSGTALGQPIILFTKVENDIVEREISKLGSLSPAPSSSSDEKGAEESLITIDHFSTVKLRTAVVLEAERVAKSEKLLKLQVDLGGERRQILAGIAKHYAPEDLVGTVIVVVANLKPAKLMGMESQGMVLAASNADGKLTLVSPRDAGIGSGAEVR